MLNIIVIMVKLAIVIVIVDIIIVIIIIIIISTTTQPPAEIYTSTQVPECNIHGLNLKALQLSIGGGV